MMHLMFNLTNYTSKHFSFILLSVEEQALYTDMADKGLFLFDTVNACHDIPLPWTRPAALPEAPVLFMHKTGILSQTRMSEREGKK
jgi:hypothetical protein